MTNAQLYVRARLLRAEIIMNGMIAENLQRVALAQSMAYREEDFQTLAEEYTDIKQIIKELRDE